MSSSIRSLLNDAFNALPSHPPGYKYLGPGTPIKDYINGDFVNIEPKDAIDESAAIHDIMYYSTNQKIKNKADQDFINRMNFIADNSNNKKVYRALAKVSKDIIGGVKTWRQGLSGEIKLDNDELKEYNELRAAASHYIDFAKGKISDQPSLKNDKVTFSRARANSYRDFRAIMNYLGTKVNIDYKPFNDVNARSLFGDKEANPRGPKPSEAFKKRFVRAKRQANVQKSIANEENDSIKVEEKLEEKYVVKDSDRLSPEEFKEFKQGYKTIEGVIEADPRHKQDFGPSKEETKRAVQDELGKLKARQEMKEAAPTKPAATPSTNPVTPSPVTPSPVTPSPVTPSPKTPIIAPESTAGVTQAEAVALAARDTRSATKKAVKAAKKAITIKAAADLKAAKAANKLTKSTLLKRKLALTAAKKTKDETKIQAAIDALAVAETNVLATEAAIAKAKQPGDETALKAARAARELAGKNITASRIGVKTAKDRVLDNRAAKAASVNAPVAITGPTSQEENLPVSTTDLINPNLLNKFGPEVKQKPIAFTPETKEEKINDYNITNSYENLRWVAPEMVKDRQEHDNTASIEFEVPMEYQTGQFKVQFEPYHPKITVDIDAIYVHQIEQPGLDPLYFTPVIEPIHYIDDPTGWHQVGKTNIIY